MKFYSKTTRVPISEFVVNEGDVVHLRLIKSAMVAVAKQTPTLSKANLLLSEAILALYSIDIFALNKFRCYLLGKCFVLFVDHKALLSVLTKSTVL